MDTYDENCDQIDDGFDVSDYEQFEQIDQIDSQPTLLCDLDFVAHDFNLNTLNENCVVVTLDNFGYICFYNSEVFFIRDSDKQIFHLINPNKRVFRHYLFGFCGYDQAWYTIEHDGVNDPIEYVFNTHFDKQFINNTTRWYVNEEQTVISMSLEEFYIFSGKLSKYHHDELRYQHNKMQSYEYILAKFGLESATDWKEKTSKFEYKLNFIPILNFEAMKLFTFDICNKIASFLSTKSIKYISETSRTNKLHYCENFRMQTVFLRFTQLIESTPQKRNEIPLFIGRSLTTFRKLEKEEQFFLEPFCPFDFAINNSGNAINDIIKHIFSFVKISSGDICEYLTISKHFYRICKFQQIGNNTNQHQTIECGKCNKPIRYKKHSIFDIKLEKCANCKNSEYGNSFMRNDGARNFGGFLKNSNYDDYDDYDRGRDDVLDDEKSFADKYDFIDNYDPHNYDSHDYDYDYDNNEFENDDFEY